MIMLTLYASPESLYCAKLRILLRYKGVEWREIMPDGGCGSAEYRAMIPSGTMPAIDHDGLILADSEAIAEYLEEIVPEPSALPGDAAARARHRERARFHDTRLEPELRKLFPHVSPGKAGSDAVIAQQSALNERLAELARVLDADDRRRDEEFTLGECGFPVTFAWLDRFISVLRMDIHWPQSVLDYRQAFEQLAAVREELVAYAPAMDAWIASRPD